MSIIIQFRTVDPLRIIRRYSKQIFISEEAEKNFIKRYINDTIAAYEMGSGERSIDEEIHRLEIEGFNNYSLVNVNYRAKLKSLLDELATRVLLTHCTKHRGLFLLDYSETIMSYAKD